MKEKLIKKYSRDLPDDILNSCPEFAETAAGAAGAASGKASGTAARSGGSGRRVNIFKFVAVPAVLALLVAAGAIAGLIISKNQQKLNEPDNIIGNSTAEPTEIPTVELTPAATNEPAATPTVKPTAAPTETAEPTPGATAEPTPIGTPMFEAPASVKYYTSRYYNETIAALTESSFSGYGAMRKDYDAKKAEYGPKFGELIDLIDNGTIKPMRPVNSGDRSLSVSVHTNGQFNLPMVEWYNLSYNNKYLIVDLTYLKLTGSEKLENSNDIAEVVAVLDPTIPLATSNDYPLPEGYKAIRYENLKLNSDTVRAIVHELDKGVYYRFILKGCIVCVHTEEGQTLDSGYWETFNIEECEPDMTGIDGIVYEEVPRSTDPSRLGKDEAIMLIRDAVNIVRGYKGAFQWYAGGTEGNGFSDNFGITLDSDNIARLYRPVIDGYDAEGILALINKTFTPDVAAAFSKNYQTLFDLRMRVENGITYYYFPYGAQTQGYYSLLFSEEELNGLVLGAVDNGTKTVSGQVRTYFNGEYTDRGNRETTIYFTFKWDGGQWKISAIDTADAAFSEYAGGFVMNDFSVDNARRVIRAVLSDLYVYTRISGTQVYESSMIAGPTSSVPSTVYRGARPFYIVTGTLADSAVWQEYASRFLTPQLVERLLYGNGCAFQIENGRVYTIDSGSLASEDFNKYVFDMLELEVLESGATRAVVRLHNFNYAYRRSRLVGENVIDAEELRDLDFEFTLVDGVWKLSGGNFLDRLDAVYLMPETEPYPSDSDPSTIPPAPGKDAYQIEQSLFAWSHEGGYWATTYREVHLKPGESIKIPVLWRLQKTVDPELYTINVEFSDTDAVNFQLLPSEAAPECELCFVASALKPGEVKVHVYGTYDPDKLTESPGMVLEQEEGVVIDVEITIVVAS